MSFNVINVEEGVPMLYGEPVLFTEKNVKISFTGSYPTYIKGSYDGTVYVTSTLFAFVRVKTKSDILTSFSTLQRNIQSFDIGQPLFGCNHLKLTAIPEPGGGAIGNIVTKMEFYDGGTYQCYKVLQNNIRNLPGVCSTTNNYARTNIPEPPPHCPEYKTDAHMNQYPPDYDPNVRYRGPPDYH